MRGCKVGQRTAKHLRVTRSSHHGPLAERSRAPRADRRLAARGTVAPGLYALDGRRRNARNRFIIRRHFGAAALTLGSGRADDESVRDARFCWQTAHGGNGRAPSSSTCAARSTSGWRAAPASTVRLRDLCGGFARPWSWPPWAVLDLPCFESSEQPRPCLPVCRVEFQNLRRAIVRAAKWCLGRSGKSKVPARGWH